MRAAATVWLVSLALSSAAEHEAPAEAGEKKAAAHAEKAAAPATEKPVTHEEKADLHPPEIDRETKGEIAGYAGLAKKAADEQKWQLADHFLQLIAEMQAPEEAKKGAFRELAGAYQAAHQTSRAIAIYEKMAELYPHDPDTAEVLFQLGLMYREHGVPKLSISRFYSVLNSALKSERGLEGSRELAKRAQWEIAQTYFLAEDFAQARKFFDLFSRLELSADEQARVRFQLARCRYVMGDLPAATAEAKKFLQDFPEHVSAPECRYLLACALRDQKKQEESLAAVLELLRAEKAKSEQSPEQWILWQKKTGNEFANHYYQEGDFHSALTVYQALARLGEKPDWQWPVIYQMGLCFERLELPQRAGEAYRFIIEDAKKPDREPAKLPESVRDYPAMARWRGEQLAWHLDTQIQLARLLGPAEAKTAPASTAAALALDPLPKTAPILQP